MKPDAASESVPIPRCRQFTLLDALILMAALALALALARLPLYYLGRNVAAIPFRKLASWDNWTAKLIWQGTDPLSLLAWIYVSLAPFLLSGSLAYLTIRLRRPRPLLREVAREQGMLAHEVLIVLFLLSMVVYLAVTMSEGDPEHRILVASRTSLFALTFGVPTAWLVQYCRGRAQPEAGWIDRLGRFLGVGWSVDFSLILAVTLFFW